MKEQHFPFQPEPGGCTGQLPGVDVTAIVNRVFLEKKQLFAKLQWINMSKLIGPSGYLLLRSTQQGTFWQVIPRAVPHRVVYKC